MQQASRPPTSEDLQRTHVERLLRLERRTVEAQRYFEVTLQQITTLREALGLPPLRHEVTRIA